MSNKIIVVYSNMMPLYIVRSKKFIVEVDVSDVNFRD